VVAVVAVLQLCKMEGNTDVESGHDASNETKLEPKSVSNIRVSFYYSSPTTSLVKLMIHATLTQILRLNLIAGKAAGFGDG
jgi:hypothetical protein